jgi:hypothetical protein
MEDVLQIGLAGRRVKAHGHEFHGEQVLGGRNKHAQAGAALARVSTKELMMLRKTIDVGRQVCPHAVAEPILRPAALGGNVTRQAVDKILVGIGDRTYILRCDAEIGRQHERRATVDRNLHSLPLGMRPPAEFGQSVVEISGGQHSKQATES